jgi:uncharacterized metal-binding protein
LNNKEAEIEQEDIVLIACSGSEYNGELARRVAIRLNEKSSISSMSSMFCSTIFLKNVLLQKEKMVEITKDNLDSKFIVVIEGCKTSCESLILKSQEIDPDMIIHVDQIVPKEKLNFNDLEAFKKRKQLTELKKEDINKVTDYILDKLRKKGFTIE